MRMSVAPMRSSSSITPATCLHHKKALGSFPLLKLIPLAHQFQPSISLLVCACSRTFDMGSGGVGKDGAEI